LLVNAASRNQTGSTVSLDQLLALNDEIAALVRAGIPLEKGLTELGQEAPGKLGVLASRLSERLQAGESLVEILEKDETTFPPVWRAVVLAGIRSDHLAAALESLSRTGRRAVELRRSMALALVYPSIVVTLAFFLLVFSFTTLVPVVANAYTDLTGTLNPVLATLADVGARVEIWGAAVPVLAALLFAWWWQRSGRLMRTFRGGDSRRRFLFGRRGGRRYWPIRQALSDGKMATFAELLSLLDKHQVPLPEAIVLAADASGDRALSGAARKIAQRLQTGETFAHRHDLPAAFPPLLGWSIVAGMGHRSLQRALSASAEMYRRRALQAANWAIVYLPMVLTVVLGGGAVVLHAAVIFFPLISLMYQLSMP
jgi:general secretion pathway protein F